MDILITYCATMNDFRNNLRRIMAARGITTVELAKKSGVHYVQVNGYLKAAAKGKFPSLRNLIALARALNCSLEELTGLENLKGVERDAETTQPVGKAREVADAFDKLPEGDIRRQLIEQILLGLKKDVNHVNHEDQEGG